MTRTSSGPSRPKYDLPLPHGIDHEVPRWSVMYSMFSEALRLFPPQSSQTNNTSNRTATVEAEQSSNRKRSCSTDITINPSNPDARVVDINHGLYSTIERIGDTLPSDALSSVKPNQNTVGEEISPIPRDSGAEVFFAELDALLRF